MNISYSRVVNLYMLQKQQQQGTFAVQVSFRCC